MTPETPLAGHVLDRRRTAARAPSSSSDTVELVVCPRCYASGRDPEIEPDPPATNCRRCHGTRVVPIDELPPAERGAFRAITENWIRCRPERTVLLAGRREQLRELAEAMREHPPLVAGGQGRPAQQVEDDASGAMILWALGALALLAAWVIAEVVA